MRVRMHVREVISDPEMYCCDPECSAEAPFSTIPAIRSGIRPFEKSIRVTEASREAPIASDIASASIIQSAVRARKTGASKASLDHSRNLPFNIPLSVNRCCSNALENPPLENLDLHS